MSPADIPNDMTDAELKIPPIPEFDFTQPAGEPALCAPDSVTWQVFKNPVSLFAGGITAVLLEFADPRIRSGVWDHSIFPQAPVVRMKRTGHAAMMTVYGPKSRAERLIAGVTRMHSRVEGKTPSGEAYKALDPELLNWVQATASFGFLMAYHHFVRPLSQAERDSMYAESEVPAALYGATAAPRCEQDFYDMMERLKPGFEPHEINTQFLDIVSKTSDLPVVLRPLQGMLVKAGVDILPASVREVLELGPEYDLSGWERSVIRGIGRLFDRIPISSTPAVQASKRLGLPANYLYRRKA
ncbi:oxygenase MpaB family protein [Maricaulis parjimensis]|uniref:oxygenase MpaB family protein n=1 Tax=Maricaulis parjimensis TaxID=144023 RepID=UPI00193AC925|nr:oxygenase MpaB family protein [Maricaulis parjimensis]